jgi:hypothetical protein
MVLIVLSFVGVYFGSHFPAARKWIESPGLTWLIGLQVFRVAWRFFWIWDTAQDLCRCR